MTEKDVYKTLAEQAPNGYRINELITVSYPVRKVRINTLVNKAPDENLVKVYNVLLRAIELGFDKKESLFDFLGLQQTDEFILRELFLLRERGLLDLVSEKWYVTEEGKKFVKDNAIFRIEENEEYEFLIDGVSGNFFSSQDIVCIKDKDKNLKYFDRVFNAPIKSPDLLKNRYQDLYDLYKRDSQGNAYLINYDEKDILFDDNSLWIDYWFVEYIPKKEGIEPYIEIRSTSESLRKNDELSQKCNNEYWGFVSKFTDSDRKRDNVAAIIRESWKNKVEEFESQKGRAIIQDLTIWETKQKFVESLKNVKEQILIESPWIKRATLEYLPFFKELLKKGKKLIILYGIDENSEHDSKTLKELEKLQQEHKSNFILVELSEHLKSGRQRFTGTHRKLLIKDNDYYISGSFNFLSFAKQEGERVANEESHLITIDVKKKWENVIKEYNLPIQSPSVSQKHNISDEILVINEEEEINDIQQQSDVIPEKKDVSSKYQNKSLSLNSQDIEETTSEENWFQEENDDPKMAVIELSTKAVKWLIPKVDNHMIRKGFHFDNFIKGTEKTETGNGLDKNNMMDMHYFRQRVLPKIKKACSIIKENKVDVVYCVATAAYRSAKNRQEILDIIKTETGLNVSILSKKQESEYTLWAYLNTSSDNMLHEASNVILIDQGGGSTEIALFKNQELKLSHSFDMGTTVLKNDFFSSKEEVKDSLKRIEDKYKKKLSVELHEIYPEVSDFSNESTLCLCVGTAITAALGDGSRPNKKVHDRVLSIENIEKSIEERTKEFLTYTLSSLDEGIQQDPTMDKRLCSCLGLPIILRIIDYFGINELRINGTGLWYGVFYRHFTHIH